MNAQKGLTVIGVFHDLNIASEYCDRLILLNKGEVYAEGPASEVITASNIDSIYGVAARVLMGPTGSKPHVFITRTDLSIAT